MIYIIIIIIIITLQHRSVDGLPATRAGSQTKIQNNNYKNKLLTKLIT